MKRLHHFLDRFLSAQGRDAFVRTPRASGGWVGGTRAIERSIGLGQSMNGTDPGEGSA